MLFLISCRISAGITKVSLFDSSCDYFFSFQHFYITLWSYAKTDYLRCIDNS